MDMMAAALRGGVKATLGAPGDLEGLGRMGINAMGGNVNSSDAAGAPAPARAWEK